MEIRQKHKISIPNAVKLIYEAFVANSSSLHIVGGAVRDSLLEVSVKDWDLVTELTPDEVIILLSNKSFVTNIIPTGKAFGVITAVVEGEEFQIATFRSDGEYLDGRSPETVTFGKITDDYQRRDISYNSLYYDISSEEIVDFTGGIEDLKNKVTKTVGNPFDRFEEDQLRVCRIIRFANRFSSALDDETKKAIYHYRNLEGVSNERIRIEFLSGLKSAVNPENFLKDYRDFEIFNRMFEGAEFFFVFYKDLRDPVLVLANILAPNSVDIVSRILTQFTASNTEKENITFLLKLQLFVTGFDKTRFDKEKQGKIFLSLHKSREIQNSNLSDEQIIEWAKIRGLNQYVMGKFLAFKIKFTAADFPNIPPSAELGKAITVANAEQFLKSL